MYSLKTIKAMNRETAKRLIGKEPYVAVCDRDEKVFKCPDFGDYRPKGWQLAEQYFVDMMGDNSPAGTSEIHAHGGITTNELIDKVKAGYGYAIIETGQFQLYIGEFEKLQ